MSVFADNDKVADLRIAIDPAQNPSLAPDSCIAPYCGPRAVHLRHVVNPAIALMAEVRLRLDVS